jgi:hypothetical protein
LDAGAAACGEDAGAAGVAGMFGSLIVALGFGGKLMRTVSFLGCTFEASAGFASLPGIFG